MAAQYQSPNLYDQQQQQYGSQAQPGSEQYGNPSQPGNEQYENPSGAGAEQYGNPSAAGNAQYGDNQGYGENQGINEQAQPSQPDAHQGAGAQGQPPSEHSAIQKGTPAAPAYHGQFHPAYTKPHDDPHHKMILQGLHHKGADPVKPYDIHNLIHTGILLLSKIVHSSGAALESFEHLDQSHPTSQAQNQQGAPGADGQPGQPRPSEV